MDWIATIWFWGEWGVGDFLLQARAGKLIPNKSNTNRVFFGGEGLFLDFSLYTNSVVIDNKRSHWLHIFNLALLYVHVFRSYEKMLLRVSVSY